MKRAILPTMLVAVLLGLVAGCQTKPGQEVVAFSRNDYVKSKVTPMVFAPKTGLYKLYGQYGTDEANKKEATVLAEVRMMEGGRMGFRDKEGKVVAFAQVSEQLPDGAWIRQDKEFPLGDTVGVDRVYWKYIGK